MRVVVIAVFILVLLMGALIAAIPGVLGVFL